eukprot:TRINITY_DN1373_c0_g1_i1.p1 TRINITY_DN1373_c0_g1~~TRINITY_DN1373_c0_g1_i1.p1  ORF type:complete len:539 (+),score=132.83 TRINITY_DN1373_c0_g1_i1:83-1699(+)
MVLLLLYRHYTEPAKLLAVRVSKGFAKSKSSKMWMNEHVSDTYVRQAKLLNYRSRAAFKLIEIDTRYGILKPGNKVIDLGAAPGGWTQVAVEKTGSLSSKTTVLAIDRDNMHPIPGAEFIQGDIEEEKTRVQIKEFFRMEPVDVVLSDMAPNFMGDQDVDHMGISVLNAVALRVCFHNLKIGGTLLMKSLYGTYENKFFDLYSLYFKNFIRIKPSASRSRSTELFYLGTGYKLNEKYMKHNQIIQKATNKKGELDWSKLRQEDFAAIGIDVKQMEKFLDQMLKKAVIPNVSMEKEIKKQIAAQTRKDAPDLKDYGVSIGPEPSEDSEEIFKVQRKRSFMQENEGKFTFAKRVPQSFKEMEEEYERQKKIYEENKKAANAPDDEGLFFPEEEYKSSRTTEMPGLSMADDLKDEQMGLDEKEEEIDEDLDKIKFHQEMIAQRKLFNEKMKVKYPELFNFQTEKEIDELIMRTVHEAEQADTSAQQEMMKDFEDFEFRLEKEGQRDMKEKMHNLKKEEFSRDENVFRKEHGAKGTSFKPKN